MPTKVIAACLGLAGFAAAILAGLSADNPAEVTLKRALYAMVLCWAAGLVIANVAFRAMQEHVDRYKRDHPLEPPTEAAEPTTNKDDATPPGAPTAGRAGRSAAA